MANQKVPQLPILSAVTGDDLFYVVDVSDTTDDPTGSSKQITRDEILTEVNQIDFNTTATTTHLEGRISWNDTLKTLEVDTENSDVQLKVGHEMVIRVNNQTGGVLSKGRAVYINGEQGNRPTVTYGTYTGDSTSAAIVGLIAEDISNNQNGYVIVAGILDGINTSSYTPGTPLYLFTGGTLTSTRPQAPNHDVRIAKVVVQDATIGSLYVSVQNGYELDELHDVRITSVSENDVLVRSTYNGSPVWVNTKTMSGLTYVGVTTISATTISGTTFYGNGTNLTGVVKGSGTANYIPKWTGTTGIGNSQIQDDNTSVGINTSPTAAYKLKVYAGGVTAIHGETIGGTNDYGVYGLNIGDGPSQTYVGILGYGAAADTSYIDSIYVGGRFLADGSNNNLNYGGWFQDGTEGLNKVLISATADGKTNWSSNLTGLTSVSATTISGTTIYGNGTNLTGVVKGSGTANYLPRWTGTTGLGNSVIQDNGTNIGIGGTPSSDEKVTIFTSSIDITSVLWVRHASGTGGNRAIYGASDSGLGSQTGVVGIGQGHPTTGTSIGVQGYANNGLVGIGVYGAVGITEGNSMITAIGGYFDARGDGEYGNPANSYGLQVRDNTEGVDKILQSKTSDGKTNWVDPLTIQTAFNYGLANAIMTGTFLT